MRRRKRGQFSCRNWRQCGRVILHRAIASSFYACVSPVLAMTQCPQDFGPKDPIVNVIGWIAFSVGIVVGLAFAVYVIRRTRSLRLRWRLIAALGALAGMLSLWLLGLGVAMSFFLSC